MNAYGKSSRNLEDVQINVKLKLSALWVALMFCYTYADILGFYAPGNLAELVSGEIAGIQMTQGLLLGSAILMVIPSLMIFLSLVLKAQVNRIVNISVGLVYIVVLVSTFFYRKKSSLLHPFYDCKSGAAGSDCLAWVEVTSQGISRKHHPMVLFSYEHYESL